MNSDSHKPTTTPTGHTGIPVQLINSDKETPERDPYVDREATPFDPNQALANALARLESCTEELGKLDSESVQAGDSGGAGKAGVTQLIVDRPANGQSRNENSEINHAFRTISPKSIEEACQAGKSNASSLGTDSVSVVEIASSEATTVSSLDMMAEAAQNSLVSEFVEAPVSGAPGAELESIDVMTLAAEFDVETVRADIFEADTNQLAASAGLDELEASSSSPIEATDVPLENEVSHLDSVSQQLKANWPTQNPPGPAEADSHAQQHAPVDLSTGSTGSVENEIQQDTERVFAPVVEQVVEQTEVVEQAAEAKPDASSPGESSAFDENVVVDIRDFSDASGETPEPIANAFQVDPYFYDFESGSIASDAADPAQEQDLSELMQVKELRNTADENRELSSTSKAELEPAAEDVELPSTPLLKPAENDQLFVANTGDVIQIDGDDGFDHIDLACFEFADAKISPGFIDIDNGTGGKFQIQYRNVDYVVFANHHRVELE